MRFNGKAAAVAVGAVLVASTASSVPAFAAAGGSVARYQTMQATITSSIVEVPGADHMYTTTLNPCDGSFSGTGNGLNLNNGVVETISGSLSNGQLNFRGVYSTLIPGYYYDVTATVASDGSYTGTVVDSQGSHYKVYGQVTETATSSFTNHGQYVSSAGGGSDAAHSCIGMPMQSNS